MRYGPAGPNDIPAVAALICTASEGVIDFLFDGLVPGATPVQIVAHGLRITGSPYSYESVVVARDDERVVGMSLAYAAEHHAITDQMRQFLPADRLAHLSGVYAANVDASWFLDALCVEASHRRRGTGEALIEGVMAQAQRQGYRSVSLIVFADNEPALRLYRRLGFDVVRAIDVKPNAFIRHEHGCLLLACKV